MSSLSAPPPPVASTGAGDQLLTLAAFVQSPESQAHLKALIEAEKAALEAHANARDAMDDLQVSMDTLAKAQREHDQRVARFIDTKAAAEAEVQARRNEAAQIMAEAVAKQQQNAAADAKLGDLQSRQAALNTREALLAEKQKQVEAQKLAADQLAADLQWRLARLREATA